MRNKLYVTVRIILVFSKDMLFVFTGFKLVYSTTFGQLRGRADK